MKITVLTIMLSLFIISSNGQSKFMTRSGYVRIFSEAPLESILAENGFVLSTLDTISGSANVKMLIKAFQFEKALMQEHFNENYMESHKFPKAEFSGIITGVDWTSPDQQAGNASGYLLIHGKTQKVNIPVFISIGNSIRATGKFTLKPSDFDIKIPSIVARNIAEEIEVTFELNYSKYMP